MFISLITDPLIVESMKSIMEIDFSTFLVPLMGIFGFGSSSSSSSQTVQPDILELIQGIFGDADPQVRELALETLGAVRGEQGRGLAGGVGAFNFNDFLQGSDIGKQLQETLLNPGFSPSTSGEQGLVNSVRDQILGSTALKGLKPTTGAITQGISPTLMKLRQNRIQNLSGAFQSELGGTLAGRQQDITQRGQTIGGEQAQIDSVLNNFLSLLSLGRQTPVVRGGGSQGTSGSSSFSLGLGDLFGSSD